MNNSLMYCENLGQYFLEAGHRVDIFNNLNFSIKESETLAITGASGSGKSTLLYLLGGLEQAKTGKVAIKDQDLSLLSVNQLAVFRNKYLGFVYQFHHLLPEFSALENVCMPLLIRGDKVAKAKGLASEILAKVGLSHRMTHKPAEMSGGERQRTAIARALVTRPKCILADEPTGNLDNKTARQIYELLLQLNEDYKTSMIIVTHDMQLAGEMKRQLLLENGQLLEA